MLPLLPGLGGWRFVSSMVRHLRPGMNARAMNSAP
jgi:hypothetical protein